MTEKRTVYVERAGATVGRRGRAVVVRAGGADVSTYMVEELEQLVAMGNVIFTPAALELLAGAGVDAVLLSHTGRYRGRFCSSSSSQVTLRLAQYEHHRSDEKRRLVAAAIVAGKLKAQRLLLMRARREREASPVLNRAIAAIRASESALRSLRSLDELRGYEGAGAAAYFSAFGVLFEDTPFEFHGRSRRPPMDPINAVLSFGYTLLANAVEAAVHVTGLDPYVGFLHATASGRPSLVLDLMEEFRTPVIDRMVVAAARKGGLLLDDFELGGADEPVRLPPETVRWILTMTERRLRRQIRYPRGDAVLTWRQVIEQQARRFARHVRGDEQYVSFVPR